MTTHTATVDVWDMFDRIAPRYDLLNRLLSFGRDVAWRKRLIRGLDRRSGQRALDLATGTADVLISLCELDRIDQAVGADPSFGMLSMGREKLLSRDLSQKAVLIMTDGQRLPFPDNSFDAVTIAFGIRNIANVSTALSEMNRVLTKNGKVLILEFSLPANLFLRCLYLFYFRQILPRIGGAISGDSSAYRYLNRTAEAFPYGESFLKLMAAAGFQHLSAHPLTWGVATLYEGKK